MPYYFLKNKGIKEYKILVFDRTGCYVQCLYYITYILCLKYFIKKLLENWNAAKIQGRPTVVGKVIFTTCYSTHKLCPSTHNLNFCWLQEGADAHTSRKILFLGCKIVLPNNRKLSSERIA